MVFLAMEYLQGLSLHQWMQKHPGTVPIPTALAICAQIAAVMADVHAQGIVHRDLKPENIFLCPNEKALSGHHVKLLDFGIAKLPPAPDGVLVTTQIHTQEPSLIGTYTYMAPEQRRSPSTVSGRADVYALGVLLFELLAGHRPFVSDDPVDVLSAHANQEPPPLKQLVPALPGTLSAFVASMLAKEPAERPTMLRCRNMLSAPWEMTQDVCPVPGLASFTGAQAELFFGRKTETQAMLSLLEDALSGRKRWVQLEGPSGVGKSSLIQAGLLPRLREFPSSGAPHWLVATLRPSDMPLRSLAQALADVYATTGPESSPEEVERALSQGANALRDFVTDRTPQEFLLLLIIDPMEELFTLGSAECQRLDALLSTALVSPECPLRLLTSLRSDFLHRMEQLPTVARQLPGAARYPLLPMDEAALEQVIQGMAWHAGLRLGPGLAQQMVRDARGEGSRLALLGHALRELWTLSGGTLLALEDYEQLGGVGGALAHQAEELLDSLGDEGRRRAKWLLLELVQIGRGVPDTRRPRSREEALTAAEGGQLAETVLLRLSGMRTSSKLEEAQGLRLITLSGEEEPSRQRVELVHETLLHRVPSLVRWINEERMLLELHEDLEVAAHVWEQAKCPTEGLPTGTLLAYYRGGSAVPRGANPLARRMSPRAARFIRAAEKSERRRTWRRRALVAASLLAGVTILFFAARAEQEHQRADQSLQQFIAEADDIVGDLDWEFSRFPYTLHGRTQMLQSFQEKLEALRSQAGTRPEIRLALIQFQQRLADLAFHDESLDAADSHLLQALEHLQAGLADQPQSRDLRKQLAFNHSKRGKVAQARARLSEAHGYFTQALTVFGSLEAKPSEEEDDRRSMAVSLAEMAGLELELGLPNDAAEHLDRAISYHQQNSGLYNQYVLAVLLGDRAEVERKVGTLEAAGQYLEKALQQARACVQAQQGNHLYLWVLARTLVKRGALEATQNRTEEALRDYEDAQRHAREVHQGEPTNKRYALVLAQALLGYGELLQARGESVPAQKSLSEGCTLVREFLQRDSEDVRFRFAQCAGVGKKE